MRRKNNGDDILQLLAEWASTDPSVPLPDGYSSDMIQDLPFSPDEEESPAPSEANGMTHK